MPAEPLKVFICYAREDRDPLEKLMGHLAVFERNDAVQFWYDKEITGGKDWDETIRFNLKSADIVLLLISPDFFRSDYIHSVELSEALQRDKDKEAVVVPVILRKCLWYKDPRISRLQALPSEANPVFDKKYWSDAEDGFFDVAEGFDRLLEDPDTKERQRRKRFREHVKDMVLIPGGTFTMGDVMGDKEWDDELPLHEVTLDSFRMGRFAVTFDEYDAFCEATKREKPKDEGWGRGRRPVINVSWYDAVEYCNWLSEIWDLEPAYTIDKNKQDPNNTSDNDKQKWLVTFNPKAWGYRLPTEAQWEYAARQGGKKVRFGNDKDVADPKEINFDGSKDYKKPYSQVGEYREQTLPVGSLNSPNELGLHDMSGNVWEWCWDWFGNYSSDAQTDPTGPLGGSDRVARGGSWYGGPRDCRVAARDGDDATNRYYNLGFRLVLPPGSSE
ncbi:MAG: SUMF1/EgtB/PvdO family nonheme iron enzyme [Lewinellaceae bacterium]|nr:SUMF1/EgtB/PvdO family nonheme iron enzyme [Lewinellaceae bacterium]